MADVLVFAVGVAISPIPIASMLLLLGGHEPRLLGTSFALGWLAGVTGTIGVLVAVVAATGARNDDPAWIAVAQIVLGALFLAAAAAVLRKRVRRAAVDQPRWVGALDRLTAERCAGLGAVVSTVNPKNLALMLGAAIALVQADLGRREELGSIVLFVAIACLGVAVPLAVYTTSPGRSRAGLGRLRRWIVRRQSTVLAVLGVVIGAKFLYDGLTTL